MYPIETLWNSKRAMASLQKGIIDWVKFKYKLELTAKALAENTSLAEFTPFCALRFSVNKNPTAFPVGFAKPEQFDAFLEFVGADKGADEIADLQKEVEKDLAKVIFNVVEVEMADKQLKADAGSMLTVTQKSLFSWASVTTEKSITLTFQAGEQEFAFTFPIFDKKFYEEKTMDSFGFPSATRIMVVDDSPTSRKLSRLALSMAGYTNVDEAADAPSAFQKLATSSPKFSFVVADWHMPNMSGLDLLKKIRADKEMKSTPVILVTGEQNAQEVAEAIKVGVNGYVVKPFQHDTFYKMMKKASGTAATAPKKAA